MRACELVVVVATVQILIRYCYCGPFNEEYKPRSAFEMIEAVNSVSNEDVLYGDEKLSLINKADPFEYEIDARAVINNLAKRWTDAIVPYIISNTYKSAEKNIIMGAMKEMEAKSCVRFIPHDSSNPPKDYILIKKGSGCWSYVGRVGRRQDLSLSNGCVHKSIVQHELLHALGMWHEQSRLDRDNYVRILRFNIKDGLEYNFNKKTDINSMGSDYDPDSIMHYHRTAFTKNGGNTIEWKADRNRKLGGIIMTELDIEQLNQLYECGNIPVTTKSTTTTTRKTTVTKRTTTTRKTTIKPITGCTTSEYCGDSTYYCWLHKKQNSLNCSYRMIREICPMTCGCCTRRTSEECLNFVDHAKYCSLSYCNSDDIKKGCTKTCCESGNLFD